MPHTSALGIALAVILHVFIQGIWYSALFAKQFREWSYGNAEIPADAAKNMPRGVLASAVGALIFILVLDAAMGGARDSVVGAWTAVALVLAGGTWVVEVA